MILRLQMNRREREERDPTQEAQPTAWQQEIQDLTERAEHACLAELGLHDRYDAILEWLTDFDDLRSRISRLHTSPEKAQLQKELFEPFDRRYVNFLEYLVHISVECGRFDTSDEDKNIAVGASDLLYRTLMRIKQNQIWNTR